MKCKHCGEEIANDSQFCEFCGKKTGQKEYATKHVDVCWCLLPAMFLSSCLVFMFHYKSDSYRQGYFDHGLIWLVPIVVLFGFSIYYGLKKLIRPSLVLVMSLLFAGNLVVYVIANNHPSEFHHINTRIYFSDSEDGINNDVCELVLSTFGNDDLQEANRKSEIVCDALKGKGYIIEDKYTSTNTEYYAPDLPEIGLFATAILLFYLIYAFVAYKKNLKF